MSDNSKPAEAMKLPTGKLGQPTTDTAIERADGTAAASRAIAENGPQIAQPAADTVTPAAVAETTQAVTDTAQAAARTAVPIVDLYRGSARISADHLRSLCDTWISLGRGVRDMQVQWLDTIGAAGVKPELWQLQRNLYVQGLDRMFETTARMVELATKPIAQGTTH